MVTYVNLRCSSCSKSLTGGYTQSYWTIGEPVITCPNCSALNSHEHSCTEWELMGLFIKAAFLTFVTLKTALRSVVLFFVIFLVSLWFEYDMSEGEAITTAIVSIVISFTYSYLVVARLISSSKKRMMDRNYRANLKALGFFY